MRVQGQNNHINYKRLAITGIKTSSLCLGAMTFGDGVDDNMSGKIYGAANRY